MLAKPPSRMTNEEFADWVERQPIPYELVDGAPVPLHWELDEHGEIRAMSAAMPEHYALIMNVGQAIARRRPDGCRVLAGGVLLETANGRTRKPDVLLSCGRPEKGVRSAPNPVLIVEVLSESTANVDRGEKFLEYKGLPSVREVWLVDGTRRHVSIHARAEEPGLWLNRDVIGSGTFPSAVLGDAILLDELYDGVEV